MLSADVKSIRQPSNIALLVLGAASVPAFSWWMNYQVKHNRPALIPNSLWRNSSFTSICVMVLFASAFTNSMELFSSLLYVSSQILMSSQCLSLMCTSFQQVQGQSALGASLRILPALIMAVLINISTGFFVGRMPIMWVVLAAAAFSAISPLLMALIDPKWPYWYMAFIAQVYKLTRSVLIVRLFPHFSNR
jgi:hypothetical protein